LVAAMLSRMCIELRSSIPVTMVKEYCWCPTIPWIIYSYGVEPPTTPSMDAGTELRKVLRLEEVADRLGLPHPRRYEAFLASRKLGIHGYVDIVAGSNRFIVVEVKAFPSKRWKHFRYQLLAYALLVNATMGPVRRAILAMGSRAIDIEVTQHEIEKTKRIIEEVRKVILSPEPPRVTPIENKCRYCRYRRLCPHQP